jgi:hypothetical protein
MTVHIVTTLTDCIVASVNLEAIFSFVIPMVALLMSSFVM